MTRYSPVFVFAAFIGSICYPAFAVFGVIFLTEGKIAAGLGLMACVAVGLVSLMRWRRHFR